MKLRHQKSSKFINALGGAAITFATALPAYAATPPTAEQMWEIIQAQQKEIAELKAQQQSTREKLEVAEEKVEATNEAVAQNAEQLADSGPSWTDKTRVGGYGEAIYNNIESDAGEDFNQIDLRRVVLFFGHEFTDKIRFFSEIEFEHGLVGEGAGGEVALEQAFIDFDLTDYASVAAGAFLVPVGILNETHEPNTFYGAERNIVERRIIPTTWTELGANLHGEFAPGWGYDAGLSSGFNIPTEGDDAYRVREGRQEASEAVANNGALTGRIKWTGVPGVELAATLQYQDDITQGEGGPGTSSSATLFETHAAIQRGPFGLRALYARWDLDGSAPEALGRDEQTGFYIEPSYKITPKLGLFVRYAQSDNLAGSNGPSDSEITQIDAGFNYWPYEDVVLKFDYQSQEGGEDDGFNPGDGFNLGLGYQF